MTAIAHAISAALLHFVWEGLAVALLLQLTLAILRRGSANLRYVVSCAAFGIMIVLPFITAWIVYRTPGAAVTLPGQAAAIQDAGGSAAFSTVSWFSQWLASVEAWALPVWCAGVMILAVRLFWSCRHVARLRRESDAAGAAVVEMVSRLAQRMKIVRRLSVVISGMTDSPSIVGWLRPVILLPSASLLNLSASQLEAVLAHELAHIRRHDYLVNLLQTVAETLFFYQPAIWWVSSRMRNERELCCDDLVVEICGDPVGYARALTQLERLRVIAPQLAVGTTGGPLLYRIQRLTGVAEPRPASKLPAALALCLALLCFATSLRWAQAQPQNGQEAEISRDSIWVDTVKYGDLPITVRALGTLTTAVTAELNVPAAVAGEVQLGQPALIEFRQGITAAGKVARIDSPANGTVPVTVQLQGSAAGFVNQPVDGTVRIRTLTNVTYVGRPVAGQADSEFNIFKLETGGDSAVRVKVRFGGASVNSVQVLEGLQVGDRVILSDTAKYDHYERIRVK